MVFRDQELSITCAHGYWGVIDSRPSHQTELRNIGMYTNPCIYAYRYFFIYLYCGFARRRWGRKLKRMFYLCNFSVHSKLKVFLKYMKNLECNRHAIASDSLSIPPLPELDCSTSRIYKWPHRIVAKHTGCVSGCALLQPTSSRNHSGQALWAISWLYPKFEAESFIIWRGI